mmetsp:Transcript_112126/g.317856  ORF Transcript_112126/g.317856 Transcript_112126/m.317856 type:complete len:332 (+) Transcript_112126:140-1135(+)
MQKRPAPHVGQLLPGHASLWPPTGARDPLLPPPPVGQEPAANCVSAGSRSCSCAYVGRGAFLGIESAGIVAQAAAECPRRPASTYHSRPGGAALCAAAARSAAPASPAPVAIRASTAAGLPLPWAQASMNWHSSTAASRTADRVPSTAIVPLSARRVTPQACARASKAGVFRRDGPTALGTISSTHSASSSSISRSQTLTSSLGPKIRTWCLSRSMCMRQPLSCCSLATRPSSGSLEFVRVLMSSDQTAALTFLRGPRRLASCLCSSPRAASGPLAWRTPRPRSIQMFARVSSCSSLRRLRPRRHRMLSSSGSSSNSSCTSPFASTGTGLS